MAEINNEQIGMIFDDATTLLVGGVDASNFQAITNDLRERHAPSFCWRVALVGGLFALVIHPAQAETRIDGTVDSVRIEMDHASVQEVLTALGTAYDLRFRSTAPLDRNITGSLQGSLPRVIGRLLEHYDYVVKSGNGTIEVLVLARQPAQQAQPAAPLPAAPRLTAVSPAAATPAPLPSPGPPIPRQSMPARAAR